MKNNNNEEEIVSIPIYERWRENDEDGGLVYGNEEDEDDTTDTPPAAEEKSETSYQDYMDETDDEDLERQIDQLLNKGEKEGHPFRGNQYTTVQEAIAEGFDYEYDMDEEDEAPLDKNEKTVLTVFKKSSKGKATGPYDDGDFREDELLPKLAKKGISQSGKGSLVIGETNKEMRPQSCHENSSLLFSQKKITAIGTGYAYSKEDDYWVHHSWGYDDKNRIIETTIPRDEYFGIRLEGRKAKVFAEENQPDWLE